MSYHVVMMGFDFVVDGDGEGPMDTMMVSIDKSKIMQTVMW